VRTTVWLKGGEMASKKKHFGVFRADNNPAKREVNPGTSPNTKGLPPEDPETPQYPDHVPSAIQMGSTRYGKSVGTTTIVRKIV